MDGIHIYIQMYTFYFYCDRCENERDLKLCAQTNHIMNY